MVLLLTETFDQQGEVVDEGASELLTSRALRDQLARKINLRI